MERNGRKCQNGRILVKTRRRHNVLVVFGETFFSQPWMHVEDDEIIEQILDFSKSSAKARV